MTFIIVTLLIFVWSSDGQRLGQVLSNASVSSSSTSTCTPARILYFNLQPSLYGRDGELQEFKDVKAAGFNITLANRTSTPTITSGTLAGYNVLWLHSGCAGETYPLKTVEVNAIRDFYLKGGSLILDAGDNQGGGLFGPPGSDCQSRVNQIAIPLGITFTGKVQYGQSTNSCRTITSTDPLLQGVKGIFRESSGEMKTGAVTWSTTTPTFIGSIDVTGSPVFAATVKEKTHGGVIFSPQDQGLQSKCTGQDGAVYKNIMSFFGHPLDCEAPGTEVTSVEIAGGTCQQVSRPLYSSGAVRVTCPSGTVIMGGGWDNGPGELFDYSRPLEVGQGWECQGNLEAAGGSCTAICCDSFLYESLVNYRPGLLNTKLEPFCSANYQLTGGGYIDGTPGKDEDWLKPNDSGNGWLCYDDASTGDNSRCFGVCARRKDTTDSLSCQTLSVAAPQGTATGALVLCPKGTFVSGGGFEDRTTLNHDQDVSMPNADGTGWICKREGNTKTGSGANICYARCCTLPASVLNAPPKTSASSSVLQTSSPVSSASSQEIPSSIASSSLSGSLVSSSAELSSSLQSASTLPSSEALSPSSISSSPSSSPPVLTSSSSSSSALAQSTSSAQAVAMVSSVQSSPSVPPPSSFSPSPSCPTDACKTGGEAYCTAFGLSCGAIADFPCFVCLAEVTHVSHSSPASSRTLSSTPNLETQTVSAASSQSRTSSGTSRSSSSALPLTAQLLPIAPATEMTPLRPAAHPPVGATGPGTLFTMVAGAAAGFGWMRRRRS